MAESESLGGQAKIEDLAKFLTTRGDLGAFLLPYAATFAVDTIISPGGLAPSIAGLIGGMAGLGVKNAVQAWFESVAARKRMNPRKRAEALMPLMSFDETAQRELKRNLDLWKMGVLEDYQLGASIESALAALRQYALRREEPVREDEPVVPKPGGPGLAEKADSLVTFFESEGQPGKAAAINRDKKLWAAGLFSDKEFDGILKDTVMTYRRSREYEHELRS